MKNGSPIGTFVELKGWNQPIGSDFQFSPRQFELKSGKEQLVEIRFKPQSLGKFLVQFEWAVAGHATSLVTAFSGEVQGPTYTVDVKELNYDLVAYGFTSSKVICLSNTSSIPMTYTARVESESGRDLEFTLTPSRSVLPPNESQNIKIDFTPMNVGKYQNTNLIIGVDFVGERLVSIPIIAESSVPKVSGRERDFLEILTMALSWKRTDLTWDDDDRLWTVLHSAQVHAGNQRAE
jgi:hypothetical protein